MHILMLTEEPVKALWMAALLNEMLLRKTSCVPDAMIR
jgi:hypothetical protein